MPLFEIVVGDVADHEIGSASGVLQAVQQLGMSLGVAGIGTIFFGAVGVGGGAGGFVHAAQVATLVTIGLVALAFGLGYLLPANARTSHGADVAAPEPATA